MIDLHTHSTASDGTLTPEELVDLAAEKGLRAIALTDHDTVGGISAALERGNQRRGVVRAHEGGGGARAGGAGIRNSWRPEPPRGTVLLNLRVSAQGPAPH